MNKIICTTSTTSTGCTFVDWSLHYLTNQDQYFQVHQKQWVPLSMNPVNQVNAHNHPKNSSRGDKNTRDTLDLLRSVPGDGVHSFYLFPLRVDHACDHLGIDPATLKDHTTWQRICDYRIQDYLDRIDYIQDQGIPLVFVHFDPTAIGYQWAIRNLDTMLLHDRPGTEEQLRAEYQQVFFNDSIDRWTAAGLINTWDIRERMALDIRPYEIVLDIEGGFSKPHKWLNCQSLWYRAEAVIPEIMEWLGLEIDPVRFEQWLPIVQQWKQLHSDIMEFHYNLEHIIEATLKGWYYEIGPLTLPQEAIIQHCLIYRHNINFKTWGLEQLPNNTQELHKLLEPNIHSITKLY